MDEADLVARLRAGDPDAFGEVVRQHYASLYAAALSYLGSEIAAEELLDHVLDRMWDRREALQPDSSLRAYLFAAVRNGAINAQKKTRYADQRRRTMAALEEYPGLGVPTESPDTSVEHAELQERLWAAIDVLPDRMRAILSLRWREQLAWPEIAEAMGMSSAAVQMQHSRALKLLRERLPKYFAEEG